MQTVLINHVNNANNVNNALFLCQNGTARHTFFQIRWYYLSWWNIDLPAFHTHFASSRCQGKRNLTKICRLTKHPCENYENTWNINIRLLNIPQNMKIGFDHTKMKPRTSGTQIWPPKPPNTKKSSQKKQTNKLKIHWNGRKVNMLS